MAKLRHYVTRVDPLILMDEIRRITNPRHLDVLIGVGMPGPLWTATVGQKAKLMGVS